MPPSKFLYLTTLSSTKTLLLQMLTWFSGSERKKALADGDQPAASTSKSARVSKSAKTDVVSPDAKKTKAAPRKKGAAKGTKGKGKQQQQQDADDVSVLSL